MASHSTNASGTHTADQSTAIRQDLIGNSVIIEQELSKALVLYRGSPTANDVIRVDSVAVNQRSRCDSLCRCQCHLRSQVKTPKWLQRFVGMIFFSYNNMLLLGRRPCDSSSCRGVSTSIMQFQYYFPSWIFPRCLSLCTFWDDLTATGINLSFRLPKLVSSSECTLQAIASAGTVQLQTLINSGQISPFSIEPDGTSLLHVSPVNRAHQEVVR